MRPDAALEAGVELVLDESGQFALPELRGRGTEELKIIAAILELPVIEKILIHLGLEPHPPSKVTAREAALHHAV